MECYEAGQRVFGENKVQELVTKQAQLPPDIQWHFIGHLQTNKVKYVAPFISLIHSIDSLRLLYEVDRESHKHNRIIDCLLQFYIATEQTKFGLDIEEAKSLLESQAYSNMNHVRLVGVMGMGSFTNDADVTRREFKNLNRCFHLLKSRYFEHTASFRELSMGMSDDYRIAIEEGSTMIRVGTTIFGHRILPQPI